MPTPPTSGCCRPVALRFGHVGSLLLNGMPAHRLGEPERADVAELFRMEMAAQGLHGDLEMSIQVLRAREDHSCIIVADMAAPAAENVGLNTAPAVQVR